MSCSCGCPQQLVDENNNVDVDKIVAYLHLEDRDSDLSMTYGAG